MFNLFYDYHITDTRFTIYAGAGAGPFKSSFAIFPTPKPARFRRPSRARCIFSGDSTGFGRAAYQGQIGASYAVSPSIDVLFGYRYFQGNPLHFVFWRRTSAASPPARRKSAVNALETGMRFNF